MLFVALTVGINCLAWAMTWTVFEIVVDVLGLSYHFSKSIFKRITTRKRKKKKSKFKPIYFGFRRRSLPYHLVLRCRRRVGNRPRRLHGPSRREIKRRKYDKNKRYRRRLYLRNCLKCYDEFTTGSAPKFCLAGSIDEALIDQFVSTIDLFGLMETHASFGLDRPQVHTEAEVIDDTVTRAYNFGRVLCSRGVYTTPLVFDTGASHDLTPFRSDFITYERCDVTVAAVHSQGKVVGKGIVLYKVRTRDGAVVYVPSMAYHMPGADIRLFSPQRTFKRLGGSSKMNTNGIAWTLHDDLGVVDVPIDLFSNLPLLHDFVCTKAEQNQFGPHFKNAFHFFEPPETVEFDSVPDTEREHDCQDKCCMSVADETNQNLTGPMKELLELHWKFCINMHALQDMMRPQVIKDDNGNVVKTLPPIIPTKHKSTAYCAHPVCLSCKLATMKSRSPQVKTSKPIKAKEGVLTHNKYEPGDFVSADQFIVKTPGRLVSGYGKEQPGNRYHGGTLYSDGASRVIYVQVQISLGSGETVMGKAKFEEWMWNLAGVLCKEYHSDNGIFDSELFRDDCSSKQQKQSFSGVGAQHQNAHAERDIQTISYWARTMMVHAAIHWPEDGADDICLWAFAVQHAAWLYNRLPNKSLGWRTPLEALTKTKSDHRELLRTHVWGCPVFVLDPQLQDGHKIPKFNRRARMGQFLGFSDEHSSLVARVRNLSTNYVSPQYHVVFDDYFTTIYNEAMLEDTAVDQIFDNLFDTCRDYYGELAIDSGDNIAADQPPPLDDMWLEEHERREKREELDRRRSARKDLMEQQNKEFTRLNEEFAPPSLPPLADDDEPPDAAIVSDSDSDDSSIDSDFSSDDLHGSSVPLAPEGANPTANPRHAPGVIPTSLPEGAVESHNLPSRRSSRLRREYNRATRGLKDGVQEGAYSLKQHPDYARMYTSLVTDKMRDANYIKNNPSKFALTLSKQRQPPSSVRLSRKKKAYKARLLKKKLQNANEHFGGMEWEVPSVDALLRSDLARFVHFAANDCGYNGTVENLVVNWLHPLMLSAKSGASKADNPNWWQAMNGPFAEEYWKAACIEVETLEKMDSWTVMDRTDDMNVLPSTWAFKCKRFPDGLIKKFKARFCARGDKQIQGIDFFETYAPVVMWITVRLMLILECLLGLVSKQGDVTCAFLHAHLEEGEDVYLEMPQGFKQYSKNGRARVLKLKRCLYGLKQSPRSFWKYMTEKLIESGLNQSELDPCLFIGEKVIAVLYVDDILMWSTDAKHIYDLGDLLRSKGVELEEEGDAAGFLGVQLTRIEETGQILMTQEGLTQRIIEALGLDVETSTPKATPCMKKPLTKDPDGDPPHESFSYASIIGMMLYLAGHTRPDISYSVHCAARFTFCPKRSHEEALKRIGRYLLYTKDKGLILTPAKNLNINAYPDADFAGLYGYEDSLDPVCVRSRTGFIITVANCPVLWQSKLQTETATSTMEAEIVAMSSCCKELFPIIDMVGEIGKAVGLTANEATKMHIAIHEDNAGALILAKTVPPQFTPRSKHYAIKTHWFREQIIKRGIELVKIETLEQLGDIATKCIPQAQFEYLRKKLMGW